MSNEYKRSPSGQFIGFKGTVALASFVIPVTAAQTVTGTLTGALVGDAVAVSPRADPTDSDLDLAWVKVSAANTIMFAFTNAGASSNQAAITFDVAVFR